MDAITTGVGFAGLTFSSWAELVFALLMFALCAGFGYCILYLGRLLLAAFTLRKQVVTLSPSNTEKSPGRSPVFKYSGIQEEQTPDAAGVEDPNTSTPESLNAGRLRRFVLLIPAHNEELLLGAALDSLQQMDYPRADYEIVVIADNCTDQTAEIARTHGAVALERFDTDHIGKGYALEWALQGLLGPADNSFAEPTAIPSSLAEDAGQREEGSLSSEWGGEKAAASCLRDFDAVVILDADTQVSPNLLTAFARGLDAGHNVMQARYDVLNVGESWRTKLMTCALALAHVVKPLGRERLGLSDGLKGNGMCFARKVVVTVPWSGASITEDIEYTLRLCRAGYRVAFLPEACVWAQMPTTGAQATSQRKRWEGGRYRLLFTVAPGLLWEGVRRRSRLLRDRAMEIIIPPFAEMFAIPLLLLLLCAGAARGLGWTWAAAFAWAWAAILILQGGYLLGGLVVARVPASVALSLLYAPGYIVWKLGVYAVMAVTRSAGGWKRTERHQLQEDSTSGS